MADNNLSLLTFRTEYISDLAFLYFLCASKARHHRTVSYYSTKEGFELSYHNVVVHSCSKAIPVNHSYS